MVQPAEMDAQPAGTLDVGGLRRVLVVLCVTEIVSWGVLYYAFPVLAPSIAADTGWSVSMITAGFSTGLVVSALAGIPAGRWLDRVGPRPVMTVGSVLGVPAVVGIALAPNLPSFFAAWVLAGVAMAGTLYPPAFAALTRWWGPQRVRALTALTLLAGLASTIFAPTAAALLGQLGWRHTYLALAGVLAVITIPAHLFGLRGRWPGHTKHHHSEVATEQAPREVVRSRAFLLLVPAIALGTFAAFAVVVNQVPLLIERGLSTSDAAWALGLGGLGQVLGRLGYGRLTTALSVRMRAVVILALSAAGTLLLGLLPGPEVLLIAAAMLAGAARGVFTLLQATAVSDRWGAAHYGRLNGLLSAPSMIATALAPWAGAAIAVALGGYPGVFVLLAAIAALAAVLATGTVPHHDKPTTVPHDPDGSFTHLPETAADPSRDGSPPAR
ncbi:MFS transporter [Pseudonocardia benzenivorans]